MTLRTDKLHPLIGRLDALLGGVTSASPELRCALTRWRADAAAARFHLQAPSRGPLLIAVVGGTGTGKSTLVNRILGEDLSATSLLRTFTSGAVALTRNPKNVPEGWLGVEHAPASPEELPAQGRADALVIVTTHSPVAEQVTIVDTPDLDGDQPAHHAQADRAFRWAQAVLFLVTPEKYQMTELLPYYRLADRYALPAMFVMNKCEETAVAEDYRLLLSSHAPRQSAPDGNPQVFIVPRDDAAYEPPPESNLASMQSALAVLPKRTSARSDIEGLQNRIADLSGRFSDQILPPLREARREADRLIGALRGLETPPPGIDVNPLTLQLQRRMQQRSILYLMGPQRVLDRVRQAPSLLVRLPRVAWDYVMRGEISADALNPSSEGKSQEVPDFAAVLADQFALLQSRIDDVLRSSPSGARWVDDSGYNSSRADLSEARKIVDEELADLKLWLEKRWNATPRDTRALNALLKRLPGGQKLVQWTEAAPYLLTIILVTHGAFFGHLDLIVLGGYGLATWLSERLSNEVAARTRTTNARIADRYTRLAHQQINRVSEWLNRQAPPQSMLAQLQAAARDIEAAAGFGAGNE